jgi:Raf kinase inhibitor-like YbhB/YbcL family protein
MPISIRSMSFEPEGPIPRRYTGDGEDVSPALEWSGVPAGTAELVLVVDDPDAPVAEPWVHWVVYGIPAGCAGLPEGFHGSLTPPGLGGLRQGTNSWNTVGYRGPAPPRGHGPHRYRMTLYALDRPLDAPAGLDKARLLDACGGHILDEGQVVGTYERPG